MVAVRGVRDSLDEERNPRGEWHWLESWGVTPEARWLKDVPRFVVLGKVNLKW